MRVRSTTAGPRRGTPAVTARAGGRHDIRQMRVFPARLGRVTDFISENLTGSRFEDVYLTDARFHGVDLTNARFHLVDLTG